MLMIKLRWNGNGLYVGNRYFGSLKYCESSREYRCLSHIASVSPKWTESEQEARKALEDAVIEWFKGCGVEVEAVACD